MKSGNRGNDNLPDGIIRKPHGPSSTTLHKAVASKAGLLISTSPSKVCVNLVPVRYNRAGAALPGIGSPYGCCEPNLVPRKGGVYWKLRLSVSGRMNQVTKRSIQVSAKAPMIPSMRDGLYGSNMQALRKRVTNPHSKTLDRQ